jgi:hypothetical protein
MEGVCMCDLFQHIREMHHGMNELIGLSFLKHDVYIHKLDIKFEEVLIFRRLTMTNSGTHTRRTVLAKSLSTQRPGQSGLSISRL